MRLFCILLHKNALYNFTALKYNIFICVRGRECIMEIQLQNFTPAEQATFRLRALYEHAGYRKNRCSRFEE